jgi:hypothetical protein
VWHYCSGPAASFGEVQAHCLLSSPTPNTKNRYWSKKVYKFLLNYYLGGVMGLAAVFRARLSSHGGGRLIIYIPKSLQPKLREYYEKGVEFVVHLYTED